ncbi:MAG: hypothetical protein UY31_C0002G0014 [Candidatus Wolfebacteria bacterium GW2011_GWE1_48_7]|uniref:Uncharacterized protein n=2 Tax=Candidatus Wolfeibacteriota TaxID=1752735 RepID=A0A0G1U801_9BACT|nr:MAG: hypothetical protein UX70_C0001G0366 [Candidatus Wolfebacteria bacterium GW2011_GWB1_47_1]KKU36487.1 MAG: hypothetical protein UX49_C0015G0013 [Candidatus Wolfebacteria bacterium GW2011_GWC2_46_275]KKU42575.1 MAG: hypothetical protein UX58_C0001G0007 [Candidatus Wolfebacteria bacterium GW2011_GWB2_46_69]KKU54690.1 MAG: hypothetical protein UX76_C0001G0149 [Candidatus Wolfebacteria bacterium GW2011_GWC1_47_103]KKU58755.1 MAG: hypothetical protein UX83_C0012G0016 [Candidatus Wolfebacteria
MRQKHIQYTYDALFMQYKYFKKLWYFDEAQGAGRPARKVYSLHTDQAGRAPQHSDSQNTRVFYLRASLCVV